MRPSSQGPAAAAAAAAVAAEHGLRSDDPIVLRDAWHVLVHLRPLPLVARVSSTLPYPEGPPEEGVIQELAVAAHAARAGAPVVPPSDLLHPGPHRRDGRVVTFWRFVQEHGALDPRAAGRALREVHDALLDFDGGLPELHAADTAALLDSVEPSADVDLVREIGLRRPGGSVQALHGDAHLLNCMAGPVGPLWHDFETACRGPRELDLAALVVDDRSGDGSPEARRALDAYGGHDAALLEELLPVYAAWIAASFMVALPRRPELGPRLERRLRWLRSHA